MNFLDNILKNIDETVNKALSPLNNSDDNAKTYQLNWQPQQGKQQLAFSLMTDTQSSIYDIGFGGTRGSGKSELGINTALTLMYKLQGAFNGLYLRNTSASLTEIIDRFLQALTRDGLVHKKDYNYNSQKNIIKLKNGASLRFYYIEGNGLLNLQGANITHCFLEEPQYFPKIKDDIQPKLNAMMRSTSKDVNTKVFWFFNPLGVSTRFLKEYFVQHGHNKVYTNEYTGKQRIFIQASINDNPLLLQNDPNYLKNLEELPEHMKKAWLEGSFDVHAGLAFPEIDKTNLIQAFDIKTKANSYFLSMDWGTSSKTSVGFYALVENTFLIRFDELVITNKSVPEITKELAHIQNQYSGMNCDYMVADPSIFAKNQSSNELGIHSIADQFKTQGYSFYKAENTRQAGFSRVYSKLKTKELLIFDTCKHFWESVPNLLINEEIGNDISQKPKQDDHTYDDLRYAVMSLTTPFEQQQKGLF